MPDRSPAPPHPLPPPRTATTLIGLIAIVASRVVTGVLLLRGVGGRGLSVAARTSAGVTTGTIRAVSVWTRISKLPSGSVITG